MHIEIVENHSLKPNGDRDTKRHDCYDYDVFVVERSNIRALLSGDNTGKLFDMFDSFQCAIRGTRSEMSKRVSLYGATIANAMGVKLVFKEYDPTAPESLRKSGLAKLTLAEKVALGHAESP